MANVPSTSSMGFVHMEHMLVRKAARDISLVWSSLTAHTSPTEYPCALARTMISIWKAYPLEVTSAMTFSSTGFLYSLKDPVRSDTCSTFTAMSTYAAKTRRPLAACKT